MGRRFIYILLLLVVCVSSCKKKEQVIPRSKMAKIYAEMFITDQKLTGQPHSIRNQIDTSWVYEPIFEKYGYTSDDYRTSVDYYIQDATRFARIVRKSAAIIDGEIKELKKQKALLEKLEGAERISYEPERVYFLTGVGNPDIFGNDTLRFYVDSTGGEQWFDPRDWADTAYYGPIMRVLEDEIIAAEEASEGVADDFEDSGFKVVPDSSLVISGNVSVVKPVEADTLHQRRRMRQDKVMETETADETRSVKVSLDKNKDNE